MKRAMKAVAAVLMVGLVSAGCEMELVPNGSTEPLALEHEPTQSSLVANVHGVLTHLDESVAFVAESDFAAAALGGSSPEEECVGASLEDPEMDCEDDEGNATMGIPSLRDEIVRILQEQVLLESQLEGPVVATQLVYRLDPAIQCGDEEQCVALLTDHPIRFSVESTQNNVYDVAVSIGDGGVVPLRFTAGPQELTAQVYLADAATAAALVKPYANVDPEFPLPTTAEGVFRLSVANLGTLKAQVALDVLESILITIPVDEQELTLSMGTGEVAVTADAVEETLGGLIFVGPTSASVPGALVQSIFSGSDCGAEPEGEMMENDCEPTSDNASLTGVFELALGGLTANTVFKLGDKAIHITGLGLGATTSTLAYNGDDLARVDINPNDGRMMDLTVTAAESDEGIHLEIAPRLEALVDLHFAPLAADWEFLPSWVMNDNLGVVFDGAGTATAQVWDGWMSIVTGTLTLSSTALGSEPIVVPAGMCLGMDGIDSETQVSLLQSVIVDSCPADSNDSDSTDA